MKCELKYKGSENSWLKGKLKDFTFWMALHENRDDSSAVQADHPHTLSFILRVDRYTLEIACRGTVIIECRIADKMLNFLSANVYLSVLVVL